MNPPRRAPPSGHAPGMDDDALSASAAQILFKHLDPIQRESGLRLDRNGRWHHEGAPVLHERLHRALTRWLDRAGDSDRFILRLGPELWAWVDVEDAPYQAALTGLAAEDTALALLLSDETTELFAGPSLLVGPDDAWYVPVKGGRCEARLGRGAQTHLAEFMIDDEAEPTGVALVLPGGTRLRFRPRHS